MTTQKSFKSRVRTRMGKTGESYTTARRHLLPKPDPTVAPPADPAEPATPVRPLGFSDDAVRERTGRGWDEWYALLDTWGGTGHNHTEIARWLVTEHQVHGWWAQSITVGYEQARGLRVPGQQPDGSFGASASKTVAVPVERLFEAFADESLRQRWLPGTTVRVRTATAPKSYRADWEDGATRIVVGFVPKGEAKAQVAIAHEKLPDAESAARQKAYWRQRLTDLKQLLET
ncbi:MAG: hypothetical protein ACRDTM_05865 [Micromonosporaceae bacterium]